VRTEALAAFGFVGLGVAVARLNVGWVGQLVSFVLLTVGLAAFTDWARRRRFDATAAEPRRFSSS
jgi:hypothetical protein